MSCALAGHWVPLDSMLRDRRGDRQRALLQYQQMAPMRTAMVLLLLAMPFMEVKGEGSSPEGPLKDTLFCSPS